ncbi:helix-turn-helix domain-containing protein [Brevundimonas sp. GCM10030266]|uniref:helix-turn-helix domain-containing protein n=1 Tax=Brevundimonas sp. GCM10030266 TaxID=3273386 RepID=UPI0036172F70
MSRTPRGQQNGPHPVDRHVGRQVCARRLALGFSQGDLAQALGITFQQVQKYEKGANRISASRLWRIAEVLRVEVASLFAGYGEEAAGMAEESAPFDYGRTATRYTVEIERLAPRLSPDRQKLACDILRDMAGADTLER